MKVEHEQRHRNGEDPIGKRRKSLQILACDAIVMVSHTISLQFHVFPLTRVASNEGTYRPANQLPLAQTREKCERILSLNRLNFLFTETRKGGKPCGCRTRFGFGGKGIIRSEQDMSRWDKFA